MGLAQKIMKVIFSILFSIFMHLGHAHELQGAHFEYWKKILHYRQNIFGNWESDITSEQFFVSMEGRRNPFIEFESFKKALSSRSGQEVVCRFPLRYKWIKEFLKKDWGHKIENCDAYSSFISKMDAKNISLVFSSFNVNNPGSIFGHTFLRVSRNRDFSNNEILDYAINFSAQDSNDQMLVYMLKGVTGFYPGRFTVLPYYYKIREYNDHEFRDIWDYDLGLSQNQIQKVVDHTWELSQANFNYYYFTRNCSYQILSLLDVAFEDEDLINHLNSFYVLPLDTVKMLNELKAFKADRVRSSSFHKLVEATRNFKKSELELIKNISLNGILEIKNENLNSSEKSAKTLEASILALDFLEADKVLLNDKKTLEKRHLILVQRAMNPHLSEGIEFKNKDIKNPLQSHKPSRFGFSVGDQSHSGLFEGLEWRAVNHELLDPPLGHLTYAQVVLFDFKFRLKSEDFRNQFLTLDNAKILEIKNYRPSSFWRDGISYDLSIGFDQRRDCLSQNCLNPYLSFGIGSSVEPWSGDIISFLLGGFYENDPVYENNSLLGIGPKINWLHFFETNALGFQAAYYRPYELGGNVMKSRSSLGGEWRYYLNQKMNLFFKSSYIDLGTQAIAESQLGLYLFH